MKTLNIKEAIRIYYSTTELNNKDIKTIFGNLSPTTVSKMKKEVKKVMNEKSIASWSPYNINTEIAFQIWNLDIKDLETRYKKLKTLSLIDDCDETV